MSIVGWESGVGRTIVAATPRVPSPHPDPLPEGEGEVVSVMVMELLYKQRNHYMHVCQVACYDCTVAYLVIAQLNTKSLVKL